MREFQIGDRVRIPRCEVPTEGIIERYDASINQWTVRWTTHNNVRVSFSALSLELINDHPLNKNIDKEIIL